MRVAFSSALSKSVAIPEFIFLTGDLGFNALESLREEMGERFINVGVAEQNMVGVAAGLAKEALRPWIYSIAPFVYARPFEQIRNDICNHHLPVIIVGNGGGYGYGVMGATHHALEDYGILLTLPSLEVYIPAFDEDIEVLVPLLMKTTNPSYLRLGLSEKPKELVATHFEPFRKLVHGTKGVIIAVGPLAGGLWKLLSSLPDDQRPSLWVVCKLPFVELPESLIQEIKIANRLLSVEEHTKQGGFGQMLGNYLFQKGVSISWYRSKYALGYPSKRYGSQRFHRQESGLLPEQLLQEISN